MKNLDPIPSQSWLVDRYRSELLPFIVVGYDLGADDPELTATVAGAFPDGGSSTAFAKVLNELQSDEFLVAYDEDGLGALVLDDDGTVRAL